MIDAGLGFALGFGLACVAVVVASAFARARRRRTVPSWPTPIVAPPSHVTRRARHEANP